MSNPENSRSSFAIHYVHHAALSGFLAEAGPVLGIIGFGTNQPDFLPPDLPYLAAPLLPISGETMFEIWTAAHPVQPHQTGTVNGVCNEDVAFGAVTLTEPASLESAAERAYLDIFDFLDQTGHKAPIRFWNYLDGITADDNGMERYRRFNIGRHRAFIARLQQRLPPVASAVGGHAGHSVIYFLAAREAAIPVENPRQVSAYDYPPVYGPRSPSFSRASIHKQDGAGCLFISGTASIVGHETQHIGDLAGQIAETAENLRAIIHAAGQPMRGEWALKIYLQDPAALPLVAPAADALFGADARRIYLRGDICRSELLLEIEAFRPF